jgi:hypothetical protein
MPQTEWNKVKFGRFVHALPTSTGVAEVVLYLGDEVVPAYVKPIGNRAGPHALACEWVGSQLARWFGLSTFDFGIMQIDEDDEILLGGDYRAFAGPAFVSKREPGYTWSGHKRQLQMLLNPEDIVKLIVFDTWILNMDRFPPLKVDRKPRPDNVFLSTRDAVGGGHRLIAMDHTHCFTNGREITAKLGAIGTVKDDRLYGLFPQFEPFIRAEWARQAIEKLREVSTILINGLLATIPREWGVPDNGIRALRGLIVERAEFLSDEAYAMIEPHYSMHEGKLPFDGGYENGGK